MNFTTGQIVTGLLGVTLVLWALGAYNRLVTLRSAILVAWAQIDEQLRRRREALPPLLERLREALPAEALDAVAAAQARVLYTAEPVRVRPTRGAAVARLAVADAQFGAAMTELLKQIDQAPGLREQEDIVQWTRELHDAELRDAFARQLFNDAVEVYNTAAYQYPTRLLIPVFGFRAAGRI
jgi:LemA protein